MEDSAKVDFSPDRRISIPRYAWFRGFIGIVHHRACVGCVAHRHGLRVRSASSGVSPLALEDHCV